MPGQQAADPFELVKADIQDSLVKAQTDFSQWQGAKSPGERKRLAGEVEDECKSIAWQVRTAGVVHISWSPTSGRERAAQSDAASEGA